MNKIEFDYQDYQVKATYTHTIGEYLGEISFDVFNEIGEDITCDISSCTLIDIHQEVIRIRKDIQCST